MRPPLRRALLSAVAASSLVACSVDVVGLGYGDGGPDAGALLDARVDDGGMPRDSGTPPRDARMPDTGTPPMDAGRGDAGTPDPDAGWPDGGSDPIDAGPPSLPVTAGLLIHFDAQDVAGGGAGSVSPATWVDLAGRDHDAACTGVTWEAAAFGPSRPGMRTDGTADSKCRFPIPDFGDVSIFVVFRTEHSVSHGSRWDENPILVGGDEFGFVNDAALFLDEGHIGFARGSSGGVFVSGQDVATGEPHAAALLRDASSGGVSLRLRWPGSAQNESGDTASGTIDSPDEWFLASNDWGSDGAFDARYAEVLIYARRLSDAEADEVLDYLVARWGI